MALEGTIRDFGLPDIFQLIGLQRKTGVLTLTHDRDQETVTVTFEGGMVVMADSSARRLEDRLGNVLVKQGRITKDRLDDALAVQKQTLQRLGHVLASSGVITGKDLRDALQVQVSQIVFRVFRWRDGRYHFAPADSADYDKDNAVPMSADFILMEGIRMVDEWPIIEKKIPSFDLVLRPVVDPTLIEVRSAEGEVGGGTDPGRSASASGRIRLSPEEERVFRKVDGVRTVQAIIDATGSGEFEVCRTLFDFLNRNLVARAGRGTTPEAEVEVRPTAASAVPGYAVAALVVLLALGGLVVQWRSPFAVTGLHAPLRPAYEALVEDWTRSRLMRIDRALQAWQSTHSVPPSSLDVLVQDGLVDPAQLKDAWGRPLQYVVGAQGYAVGAVDESGQARPGAVIDRTQIRP